MTNCLVKIAACVEGDPARRLTSAAELSKRLRGLEQRREVRRREAEAEALAARPRRRRRMTISTVIALSVQLDTPTLSITWRCRRTNGRVSLRETTGQFDFGM
jgi:hypothetical protein